MLAIAGAWALYNALRAFLVIQKSIAIARNARADYRHRIHLPVEIVRGGRRATAITQAIGTGGLTMPWPFAGGAAAGENIPAILHLPSGPLEMHLSASRFDAGAMEAAIHCRNAKDKARLSNALFSCDWHFAMRYRDQSFLSSTASRRAEQRNSWAPILMQAANTEGRQLAYVKTDAGGAPLSLLCFGRLSPATTISVAWAAAPGMPAFLQADAEDTATKARLGLDDICVARYGIRRGPYEDVTGHQPIAAAPVAAE